MPVIVLVAAGARLGLSLGKTFGGHGFDVALIARSKERLGDLTGKLAAEGVAAAGFPADVTDRSALAAALDSAAGRFGGIDVLHYSSPGAGTTETLRSTGALDVTVDNLRPQIDCICYGAITATRAVLPAMLASGTGTLLYTTGGSSVTPAPVFASAGMRRRGPAQMGPHPQQRTGRHGRLRRPRRDRRMDRRHARRPRRHPTQGTRRHRTPATGTSTPAASPPNTSSPPDPAVHAAQPHRKLWAGTGSRSTSCAPTRSTSGSAGSTASDTSAGADHRRRPRPGGPPGQCGIPA